MSAAPESSLSTNPISSSSSSFVCSISGCTKTFITRRLLRRHVDRHKLRVEKNYLKAVQKTIKQKEIEARKAERLKRKEQEKEQQMKQPSWIPCSLLFSSSSHSECHCPDCDQNFCRVFSRPSSSCTSDEFSDYERLVEQFLVSHVNDWMFRPEFFSNFTSGSKQNPIREALEEQNLIPIQPINEITSELSLTSKHLLYHSSLSDGGQNSSQAIPSRVLSLARFSRVHQIEKPQIRDLNPLLFDNPALIRSLTVQPKVGKQFELVFQP
jgi:hypothetical protein